MASNAVYENTLKRAPATRRKSRANSMGVDLDNEDSSAKPERHTTFDIPPDPQEIESQQETSESTSETDSTLALPEHSGEKHSVNWCFLCRIQVESKKLRLLFRFCAVFNILSLVFSAPIFSCNGDPPAKLPLFSGNVSMECEKVFIQFTFIAAVDFLLAVFYTLQTLARIEYLVYLRRTKSGKPLEAPEVRFAPDNSPMKDESYGSIIRLVNLVIITLVLWYSVAIGVFRIYKIATNRNYPQIHFICYWVLPLRMLSVFTAIKLLRYLSSIKSSDFREILDNIVGVLNNFKKSRKRFYQLGVVTLFYLFFIYIFALVGVQWIGGLDTMCMHTDGSNYTLAIPVTHCKNEINHQGWPESFCFIPENNSNNSTNIECRRDPDQNPLKINERNKVYLGQFRTILDAMFAVYEASSWELWIFMWYNADSGSMRETPVQTVIFYMLLFFFLVIFIQQSIFLVVIIESFADLRVESSSDSAKPVANKPAIVLSDPQGQGTELHLTLIKKESSNAFQRKFKKYYFSWWRDWIGIETAFIALVIIDAIVFAVKHSGMSEDVGNFLYGWQIAVSIVFFLEIAGILVVHLWYRQPRLFIENVYFWCLMIIAVGGLVSAGVYKPKNAAPENALVLFQAARLPRVLRLPYINKFFRRVFGNGSRLLTVTVAVLVLLALFSIVAVQIFGYLPAETQCKERTGSGQFANFFIGFQSMFQLVMQEGWTELMGEVMCYRNIWWIFINAAFIGLHLLGSLILLNMFVAAILDNLEYDEETKKQKLDQDLKKQKVESVPWDLKIYKQFGQKKISGPKISSIDVPNLTEADVRNFYNVGEATDFPVSYENESEPASLVNFKTDRRESALSDIDLLTEDKSQLLQTEVSNHGWYYGVQGILNYVKAYRQHTRTVEGSRRGQAVTGKGRQAESLQRGQSEYDEYREKYRLFDSALFCLPPEHKLRKACKKILTYRVSLPEFNPTDNPASNWRQLPRKWWNYIAYALRYIASSAPVFYWFIDLLTFSTLIVQMVELAVKSQRLDHPRYYWISDLVFVLGTLTELLLKIIVNGLVINPNGALRSVWGVMDWLITLATLVVMIVYLSACERDPEIFVTSNPALVESWIQVLLLLRALRPFRMISLFPSMRRVVLDIVEGWRSVILALVLFLLFLFLFASLGVQLFAGNNSPQAFCNDPIKKNMNECVGEFEIYIDISPSEIIPTDNTSVTMFVPRVWYNHRRDFRFDNFGVAVLTLFQVLTTEGWPQVRNLFDSDPISMKSPNSWIMSIYIHIFVFIGVNIVLQLFVGIVVNNYNEHKPNHSALLTVSQKRWSDLVERISLTRPIKQAPEPRNGLRRTLYRVFTHVHYRIISTAVILVNSCVFWIPWSIKDVDVAPPLIYVSIAFSAIFLIEMLLKFVAFGLNYFNSLRNMYDFFLGLLSIAFIIMAIYYIVTMAQPSPLKLHHVTDLALVITVLRQFTILMKYRVFQNLMETVVKTIYRSVPLLAVMLMVGATYAFVGELFFSNVRSGEALNYSMVNFDGILVSLHLVIRTMTGEDWYQIFWDTMTDEPYCSKLLGNCGNQTVAILWFISFYIIVSFFLLNVVIAVLLENFSIFYEDDDTELNRSVAKDFKQNWFYFDKKATGKISSLRVKLFLRMLKVKEFYTYKINENGVKERQKTSIHTDSLLLREMAEELRRDHRQPTTKADETEGSVLQQDAEPNRELHSFQNVIKMVAYRVEDISKRLVPHELYVRQELEESVQFDVAEACIFKWMKRFVRPVIIKQERHRRQTVAQVPKKIENRMTVLWSAPSFNPTGDDWSDQNSSGDSDDDAEPSSLIQPVARSDDEVDIETHVSEREKNLAQSYAKLAELGPPVDTRSRDKWHDWIKMQNEWMDKVETDPDNYFDDYL